MTTIRALLPSDDRSGFRSGDGELDRFFTTYAGRNQFKNHIGVSYVAIDDHGRILGYATVAASSVEVESLPAAEKKRLPAYPLPALRLARLAVTAEAQRHGVGAALLRYVLELAVAMSRDVGCVGVVVDVYATAVEYYAGYGFVPFSVLEGESSARPQPTTMFLWLDVVEAARR